MFRISRDTPAYYLTSVAKNRLPVFRKPALKDLVCTAINEARISANFLLFAYVIMPDHLHTIAGSELKPSKVVQYINGTIARRVIDYLKNNGHETSLAKLSHENRGRNYRYSLWDHHPNVKQLNHEDVFYAEGELSPPESCSRRFSGADARLSMVQCKVLGSKAARG